MAEEALRRGHPDQAIIAYQKAAARFRLMGQRLKQMAVLQHLVRLLPDDVDLLRELIDVYEELGRIKEATGARLRLAAVLRKLGQGPQADRVEREARPRAFSLARPPAGAPPVLEAVDDAGATREMPGDAVAPGRLDTQPPLEPSSRPGSSPRPRTMPTTPVHFAPANTGATLAADLSEPRIDWPTTPSIRLPERSVATAPKPVDPWSLQDDDGQDFTDGEAGTAAMAPVEYVESTDMFEVHEFDRTREIDVVDRTLAMPAVDAAETVGEDQTAGRRYPRPRRTTAKIPTPHQFRALRSKIKPRSHGHGTASERP